MIAKAICRKIPTHTMQEALEFYFENHGAIKISNYLNSISKY